MLLAPSEAPDSAFLEIMSGAPISHASLPRNRPTKASCPVSHEPYCRLSVEIFFAFLEPPDFLWLVVVDVYVNAFFEIFFDALCKILLSVCYLMLLKKIERFCIEWIEMTLCLLRCLLCLDSVSCISWLSSLMR